MSMLHIVILAIVQGITEFLPISSSGHLILVPRLLEVDDQGLLIDIAVHVGTLLAVMLYFARDIAMILISPFMLKRKEFAVYRRMFLFLILATIPVVIAGYFLHGTSDTLMRSVEIVAWATLLGGLVLYFADRAGVTVYRLEHMKLSQALAIGLFQVLALIPGVSRSGITMTAGRFMGFERPEAAKFSMLMSIPTILGAGLLAGLDIYARQDMVLTENAFLACGLAFLSALLAIWALIGWLQRATFTPFVVYRLLLGGGLLYWVYVGF